MAQTRPLHEVGALYGPRISDRDTSPPQAMAADIVLGNEPACAAISRQAHRGLVLPGKLLPVAVRVLAFDRISAMPLQPAQSPFVWAWR